MGEEGTEARRHGGKESDEGADAGASDGCEIFAAREEVGRL